MAGVALALALGAGACGGGGDKPEDEAKDVASEYFEALAKGDARAVCDHLTKEAQEAFRRQRRTEDCAAAVGGLLNGPQGRPSKEFARQIKVEKVKVSGDNATAETKSKQGFGISLQMRREDGEWKVSQSPT